VTAAEIVKLGIVLSIFLIVASIGLQARLGMVLDFLREPMLATKAMVAMFVLVPAFTIVLYFLFPLAAPLPAVLLGLAVSPMPPILPRKEMKAGGGMNYSVSLLALATLVSLIAAALIIPLAGRMVDREVVVAAGPMASILLITAGAPLVGGMLLAQFAPGLAARLVRPVGLAGNLLLAAGAGALLFTTFPAVIAAIGDGTLLVVSAVVLFGLLVGHLLGGPDEGNRGALAVATASRHPGVAIVVATAMRPDAAPQIVALVLLYLLVSVILTIPYMRWRKGMVASAP